MGIVTKRVEGNLIGSNTLSARVKRKGKKRFEKKIILKGGKDDRLKVEKRSTA